MMANPQGGFTECKTSSSALREFAIAALIVAGVSIFMLFGEFYAYSSEAGQHYDLVRAHMDYLEEGGRPLPTRDLGVLAFYPPLSHWMAAGVGELLGSGLIGMTVVASASVGLFYLAMFVNCSVSTSDCALQMAKLEQHCSRFLRLGQRSSRRMYPLDARRAVACCLLYNFAGGCLDAI